MEKILTVVVPTYNMEKYLDKCLASLIVGDGLMERLEVIVVNDGSKDSSSEIAHSYESKYPDTFIVIDKENGNYGSCVNKGIERAAGKYFRILDADDSYNTESFLEFLTIIGQTDADMILTRRQHNSKGISVVSEFPEGLISGVTISMDSFADLKCNPYLSMHKITFRTDVIRRSGLQMQTGISYTDNEFCYYPLSIVNSVLPLDMVIYEYNLDRPGQTMSKEKLSKSMNDMYAVMHKILEHHNSSNIRNSPQYQVQSQFLCHNICSFYKVMLTVCRKSQQNVNLLELMDTELKKDPALYGMTDSLLKLRMKYVHIWRKYRVFYTHPIFQLYDMMCGRLKMVKNSVL